MLKKISDVRAAVIDHIARPRLTEAARLIGAYSAMTWVLGALRVYAPAGLAIGTCAESKTVRGR